ncbi:MAG: MarC family protein [Spirochaetaceae bacterium]|jgi:multiple antibiotic resistance protein|nr:MarC family protein [Spirochaetaceae bacterium]
MIRDFLKITFTVLIVMDPIGLIPQYLSLTAPFDQKARNVIIKKALLIAALVLLVFLLGGKFLLDFFGILPGAFYISGGILFFLIAFEMIYSKPELRKIPAQEGNSVALFPLAIPFIAGPGLLTVIIMFMSTGSNWFYSFSLLFPAILIGLVCTYLILRGSVLIMNFLSVMGIFVVEKIMGLILAGFAIQFIYNGLVTMGILAGRP